jgi:hypothetical protein
VEIDGTTRTYNVTAEDDEIVQFSYYEGSQLRGISRFYIQPKLLLGDANADKHVTVVDVMLTVRKVLGQTNLTFRQRAADINGDGIITVADIMGIVNIILHKR